jgi:predicted aspartyl protease
MKVFSLVKEEKCIELQKQATGHVFVVLSINGSVVDSFLATFKDSVMLYRGAKKIGFKRIK